MISLLQGIQLNKSSSETTNRVQSKRIKNYDNSKQFPTMPKSTMEGFATGITPTPKVEVENTKQEIILQTHQKKFKHALQNYAEKDKDLREAAAAYVDMQAKAAAEGNNFVKLSNGKVGYVTSKGTFKYVETDSDLASIQGSYGCPSNIKDLAGNPKNYKSDGEILKTIPNLFVGSPMQQGQSCGPVGTNVQVMGASNPTTNTSSWDNCRKGVVNNFELLDGYQSTDPDTAIKNCSTAAADMGRSGFLLQMDNNNNIQCYTAKTGFDIENVGGSIGTKSIKSGTIWSVTSDTNNVAGGLLYNGQIAIGTLGDQGGLPNSSNYQVWGVDGNENCNPIEAPNINIQSATWGSNCDGQLEVASLF